MSPDRQRVQHYLKHFQFMDLFIEELGWNHLDEQALTIDLHGQICIFQPLAEKQGIKVYRHTSKHILNDRMLKELEREIEKQAHNHLIVYTDQAQENQAWLWAKIELGNPTRLRIHRLHKGQSGELLAQKFIALFIALEEEDRLTQIDIASRLKQAFDAEKVTKKFYDRFKKEHAEFLGFIEGITEQGDREWYTSVMLNRLMFIYFIQKKGFLGTSSKSSLDGDENYLRKRLEMTQKHNGHDTFHTFYRYFLRRLFHEGLSQRDRTAELEALLGNVPYLNGGLFDIHELESKYTGIQIPDEAFEHIFDFFDEYNWHLDDRPDKSGNEINPDVLGYIFEKYINQKQMGAYYTKEDITEYISKNAIIPYLFEAAQQKCPIAFEPAGPVWTLLRDNPDEYIYDAVAKGTALALPPEIEMGIHNVVQRTEWNKPASEDYALPTEIWREVVARRQRYEEVHSKIANGEIITINDLITYNLDIRKFAKDVIRYCEGPDLLRALYDSIESVTVLDPTCGSGAFLFAALNILKPLYEACLERMRILVDERDRLDSSIPLQKRKKYYSIDRFRAILKQVERHHSQEYFILKSIIINNLYGVDIMEEAVEICKLRLFLKLVAQVEKPDDIEPLPDIDFNVLAGNTLVGFTGLDEVRNIIEHNIYMGMTAAETFQRIEQQAKEIERGIYDFRKLQTELDLEHSTGALCKRQLRDKLDTLRSELDTYLAIEYGIDHNNITAQAEYEKKYKAWKKSHQPLHWCVEFYNILQNGGFAVIIGNPPYVEYNKKQFHYTLNHFSTLSCANLYTCVIERSHHLISKQGRHGMILPLAAFSTKNMIPLIEEFQKWFPSSWLSFYHFRPSMLFSGGKVASIPTSIYLAKSSEQRQIFSTHLLKWSTELRDGLFEEVFYCPIETPIDKDNRHYIPKFCSPIENGIMNKVLQHPTIQCYLSDTPNQNTMFYRSAGGLYWKVFINFSWPYQTTSNKQCSFQEKYERDIFIALLNSSLFWWYYTTTFDTFNLKDYMIFGFRFSFPQHEHIINSLKQLSLQLMQDFIGNAKHLKRGNTGSYTVYARKSKPIIDEIDCVLAKHYGFTDEELDFILNYDIKYRMGRDNGEEESEE